MNILVNTSGSFRIDFIGPTGLLVADAGTVAYTIFDQAGVPLIGPLPIAPSGDTGVTVVVDAALNTIPSGKRFSRRTIMVTWRANGQHCQLMRPYRVLPFALYSATEVNVRALLGLGEDELPDADVDLFSAFLSVESDVGSDALATALTSGTTDETNANSAIVAECALALLPSLRTRTLMAITDGDQKIERFRTPPDWAKLETDLRGVRSAAIAALTGIDVTAAAGGLAVFTSPTDVITG